MYNAKKEWTNHFTDRRMEYPSEYLIRIFKGEHPRQSFRQLNFSGKKICDISCGTGGNLAFFKKCGFEVYGTDITEGIVNQAIKNLELEGIRADIGVGDNSNLPFEDEFFDFIVSWNACYYMGGEEKKFDSHVKEFARILKKDGYLILSVPMKSCFIYKNSVRLSPGYQIINEDPSGVRNGEVLRMFKDEREIEEAFSGHFTDFAFGSQIDDCFGLDYHWHLIVCRKK